MIVSIDQFYTIMRLAGSYHEYNGTLYYGHPWDDTKLEWYLFFILLKGIIYNMYFLNHMLVNHPPGYIVHGDL